MSPLLSATSTLSPVNHREPGDAPPNLWTRLAGLVGQVFRPRVDQVLHEEALVAEPLTTPTVDDAAAARDVFGELEQELTDTPDEALPEHEALDAASPADDAVPAENPLVTMARELKAEVGGDEEAVAQSPTPTPVAKAAIHPPAVLRINEDLRQRLEIMESAYAWQVDALNRCGILEDGELPFAGEMAVEVDGTQYTRFRCAPFGMLADRVGEDRGLRQALVALKVGKNGIPIIMPDLRAGSLGRQVNAVRGQMAVYSFFAGGDYKTSESMPFDPDALRGEDGRSWAQNEATAKKLFLQTDMFGSRGLLGFALLDASPQVPMFTLSTDMGEAKISCSRLGLHPVSLENYHGAQALLSESERLDAGIHWTRLMNSQVLPIFNLCGRWDPKHRALLLSQPVNLDRCPNIGFRGELRVIF